MTFLPLVGYLSEADAGGMIPHHNLPTGADPAWYALRGHRAPTPVDDERGWASGRIRESSSPRHRARRGVLDRLGLLRTPTVPARTEPTPPPSVAPAMAPEADRVRCPV